MRRQTTTLKHARTGSRLALVPPGSKDRQICHVTSVEGGVLRCVAVRSREVFFIDRSGFYVTGFPFRMSGD